MNEWTVVGVIITLVGLFFTVGKPIINLNTNITTLTVTVALLEKRFATSETKNSDSHARIWEHNEEQDKTLNDHEQRIGILERGDAP